jgi:hypothetical protein
MEFAPAQEREEAAASLIVINMWERDNYEQALLAARRRPLTWLATSKME